MICRKNPNEMMLPEMEYMRAELESRFHAVSSGNRFPLPNTMGNRMLPSIQGKFRVDIRKYDEDKIIFAASCGLNKESVALQIGNKRVLEIS